MRCRHCGGQSLHRFLDLGFAPPSNAYLTKDRLNSPELYYPLRVKVCDQCWLVQTEDYAEAEELFTADYAYFSSTSSTWLSHAKYYFSKIVPQLNLMADSYVIEVASNDGYLLKNFVEAGIPCLGIEPTESTADVAEANGIPVCREFFGEQVGQQLASTGKQADLIIGNNVYAHVPDINDFTRGLKAALKPGGTITLEFPHLLSLINNLQFDSVYHEHFSYLSLHAVDQIFAASGLCIWNVEKLPTHGGSLRVYGCHEECAFAIKPSVSALLDEEKVFGLKELKTYTQFQGQVEKIKDNLLSFLIERKSSGDLIAAYGAAAKGNTLLNYAGVKSDLLPFVCDAAQIKQGKFLPGSHIPIVPPERLLQSRPDYVLIFPWNIAREIMRENAELVAGGTKFVVAIPEVQEL